MEVVLESNIASDRIRAFFNGSLWHEHIKDPQLKQINMQTSSNI